MELNEYANYRSRRRLAEGNPTATRFYMFERVADLPYNSDKSVFRQQKHKFFKVLDYLS